MGEDGDSWGQGPNRQQRDSYCTHAEAWESNTINPRSPSSGCLWVEGMRLGGKLGGRWPAHFKAEFP